MSPVLLIVFLLFVSAPTSIFHLSSASTSDLWPYPAELSTTGNSLTLSSETFSFLIVGNQSQILLRAIERYTYLIFNLGLSKVPKPRNRRRQKVFLNDDPVDIIGISIDVKSNSLELAEGTSENYTLVVQSPHVLLESDTVYGALRGLETFSQLVEPSTHSEPTTKFVVNETKIVDFPRFTFRGVLIDSSRHYLPINAIFEHLDAMAFNKMNVLHWHIVDDQSFPYNSITYPELSEKGSWTGTPDHMYSQEQVRQVIQYAQDRGIRVVSEFDSPGHTLSWGKSHPELLTVCYYNNQPSGLGPINPLQNLTWTFIEALFSEISTVFPDPYIHIGGDEVELSCYESNPQIVAWMKENNYTDYGAVQQYYETKLSSIISSLGKSYVAWQEVFDNAVSDLPSPTIIHVWKTSPVSWQQEMSDVTAKGLRAILSSPWYLNYISYGVDWPTYYRVDPVEFPGTTEQHQLVIGGEACMWGEYVDGTDLISRMWPRASAVGERLWSPRDINDVNAATPRLHAHTCRMIKRGIDAEPANGPGFCLQEFSPHYRPPWLNYGASKKRSNWKILHL